MPPNLIEKPDAELAIILDGEIGFNSSAVLSADGKIFEEKTSASPVQRLIASHNRRKKIMEFDHIDGIVETENKIFQKHFLDSQNKYGKKILEIILNGRVNISFLLNSPGGHGMAMESYLDFIRFFREKNGTSFCYVTDQACSAAAIIFQKIKHRYALSDSFLLWHLSSVATGETAAKGTDQKELAEMQDEQWDQIKGFFEDNVADPIQMFLVLKFLTKARNNPAGKDRAVSFRGKSLRAFGIVKEVFPDYKGIHQKFYENHPQFTSSDLIEKFFTEHKIQQ